MQVTLSIRVPNPPLYPASVREIVTDVRGDIRDYSRLESSMTEFAPEVVFHLAAQPIVRRGYADPVGTYSSNVMGTVHVLEAVRKTPTYARSCVSQRTSVTKIRAGSGPIASRIGWEGTILTHPAKPARRLLRQPIVADFSRMSVYMNTM